MAVDGKKMVFFVLDDDVKRVDMHLDEIKSFEKYKAHAISLIPEIEDIWMHWTSTRSYFMQQKYDAENVKYGQIKDGLWALIFDKFHPLICDARVALR